MPDNSSANKQPARSKVLGMSRPVFWIVLVVIGTIAISTLAVLRQRHWI